MTRVPCFNDGSTAIPVYRLHRESRHTDRNVFGAFPLGRAVPHPFAFAGNHSLAGVHIHRSSAIFHPQHSFENNRELLELRCLTRFQPAAGAAHVCNAYGLIF